MEYVSYYYRDANTGLFYSERKWIMANKTIEFNELDRAWIEQGLNAVTAITKRKINAETDPEIKKVLERHIREISSAGAKLHG